MVSSQRRQRDLPLLSVGKHGKRLPLDTISYSLRARVLLWWVHPLTSPLAQYAGVSLGSPPPSQVKLLSGNPA